MGKIKGSQKNNAALFCIITAAIIYSINSFVLLPLGRMLSNDVIYADSVLPMIMSYLAEFAETVAVAAFYALILSHLYHGRKAGGVFITFATLTVYKYLTDTAMIWVESGSVPTLWVWDIVDDVYFTGLELLLLLIVFAISKKMIERYTYEKLLADRVFEKTGEVVEYTRVFPFNKLYDKTNCLLRAVGACAIATIVAKLVGDLGNDVMYIIAYGFPKEGITWVYMIVNYVSKVLFGAIAYITVYTVLNDILKKDN